MRVMAGRVARVRDGAELVAQYPRYGADAGHVVLITNAFGEQAVADLPRKDAGILLFELAYVADDLWRGDAWLAAADRARQYGARFVVACQYFGYTAVADAQLP